jgi:hypothetical protein
VKNPVNPENDVRITLKGLGEIEIISNASDVERLLMGNNCCLVICTRNKKGTDEYYLASTYKDRYNNLKTEFVPDSKRAIKYPSLYKLVLELQRLIHFECPCTDHIYIRLVIQSADAELELPKTPLF